MQDWFSRPHSIGYRLDQFSVDLEPEDPEFFTNPYKQYNELREQTPLFYSRFFDAWVLTRFDDIEQVRTDYRLGASEAPSLDKFSSKTRSIMEMALFPSHTFYPQFSLLIDRMLTPEFMENISWNPYTQLEAKLKKNQTQGIDYAKEFALPFVVHNLLDVMGVSRKNHSVYIKTLNLLFLALSSGQEETLHEKLEASLSASQQIMNRSLHQCLASPDKSIISHILYATGDNYRGSPGVIEGLAVDLHNLFLVAAAATCSVLNSVIETLLRHPEQLAELYCGKESMNHIVDEVFRYETPIQLSLRVVKDPCEILGQQLLAGDEIYLLHGAANRDPDVFMEPNRFWPERGLHDIDVYSGQRLVFQQLILEVVKKGLQKTLQLFPGLRHSGKYGGVWYPNLFFRCLQSLPIEWGSH